MDFQFDIAPGTEGVYKITNFPYWFKNANDEIYTKIEFAHIIYERENNFMVEKIQSYHDDEFNIETLIDLKIGDKFDIKLDDGNKKRIKRIKTKKKYQQTVWVDSYENMRFQKVEDDQNPIFSAGSLGTRYYQIEKEYKDGPPITIIIPSVVIAQAFYLVNSLIIKNLFRAGFEELTEIVKWETKNEDNLVIGEVSLKKHGTENIKSMAKSLAFFLFSKDNHLWNNLLKMQSNLYHKILNNSEKNNYNFLIPIKEKLHLTINGNYINTPKKTFFLANEIVKVKSENNFDDLYETDYIRFIDYYNSSNTLAENPKDSTGKRSKKSNKNKKTTITKDGVNSELAENFTESGIDVLSDIVKLSIDSKASKSKSGGKPIIPNSTPYGTFDDKQPDPGSKSGGTSGGKRTPNRNQKNVIFHIIYSIVDKLKHHFTVSEHITKNNEIIVFKVSYKDKYAFLMDDDFHQRIQLIYTADLNDVAVPQINELLNVAEDNGYNWKKVRTSEKSTGFLFAQPTNYNRGGTRIVKKIKNDDGTQNQEKISDLCYLNILNKIQSLFTYSQ
ncbi:MAG: hypothetical protein LBE92_01050 [Chryseobacterium sp.]|jgi:hypothetical protein|uniref:hypothetical protein n=1 Tax=Chryseobacterium sp. TaxID=1871047 RepID=UPI00282AE6BB|nr:hypothetical protein [Chryseobacterium sp.]MDR2234686.1 hypothetical protein [Chryseobacterium sp.]